MTFTFRGCGTSTGDFSLQGWIDDLRAAIDHLVRTTGVDRVVLVGTNTGGSLAICVGADDPRVHACRAAVAPGRLRRLVRSSATLPRSRPRDRRDPNPGFPAVDGRLVARVPPLPPQRCGEPVRPPPVARDARRGRRRAFRRATPASWPRRTAAPSSACSRAPVTGSATTRGRSRSCSAGSTASGRPDRAARADCSPRFTRPESAARSAGP